MTSEKYLGHIEESDTDLWQIECPKDYTIKALLNVLSHTSSSGSNYELNLKGYLIRCKSLSNCKKLIKTHTIENYIVLEAYIERSIIKYDKYVIYIKEN